MKLNTMFFVVSDMDRKLIKCICDSWSTAYKYIENENQYDDYCILLINNAGLITNAKDVSENITEEEMLEECHLEYIYLIQQKDEIYISVDKEDAINQITGVYPEWILLKIDLNSIAENDTICSSDPGVIIEELHLN